MFAQKNKIFKDKIFNTLNKVSLKKSKNSSIMRIKVRKMIRDKKQRLNNQIEV